MSAGHRGFAAGASRTAGLLLLRGQFRTRWRRQAVLAASLAAGLAGFFLVAMVLQGAQQGVIQPLRDTLSGDARITWGSTEIAGGHPIDDYRDAAAKVRSIPGAIAAPRWETSQVTVLGAAPLNWTGGLLVGIDPGIGQERNAILPYLTWGSALPAGSLTDPASGKSYAPLVVGDAAARRLNLTRSADGAPDFTQVYIVTSGRLVRPGSLTPLTMEAVVVGTYATGIDSLDRFTAFTQVGEARRLVGGRPGDPSANLLVVHGAARDELEALGLPDAHIESAQQFAFEVMGNLMLMLQVSAGLAVALVLGVLGVWLTHEAGTVVARDRLVVAALRAVGIPFRSILQSYAGMVAATVLAALVAAVLLAGLISLVAPPMPVSTKSLHLVVPWTLGWEPVAAATLAAGLLAGVGTWAAARRLASVDVADALRA